jgi:hypothetical protein
MKQEDFAQFLYKVLFFLYRKRSDCLLEYFKKKKKVCPAPVAHACNPSYLGDRDQEDQGSEPAQTNS